MCISSAGCPFQLAHPADLRAFVGQRCILHHINAPPPYLQAANSFAQPKLIRGTVLYDNETRKESLRGKVAPCRLGFCCSCAT